MPDVQTLSELGYRDVVVSAWMALLGPRGLPQPIVDRLNTELNGILALPDVAERMKALGIVPTGGKPTAVSAQIKADLERYGPAIEKLGITAN